MLCTLRSRRIACIHLSFTKPLWEWQLAQFCKHLIFTIYFLLMTFFSRLPTSGPVLSYWVDRLLVNEIHDTNKQFPAVATVKQIKKCLSFKSTPIIMVWDYFDGRHKMKWKKIFLLCEEKIHLNIIYRFRDIRIWDIQFKFELSRSFINWNYSCQ